MNVEKLMKKTAPGITEKQETVVVDRLRLLSRDLIAAKSRKVGIMNDETYFAVEVNEWTPMYYFKLAGIEIPDKVEFKSKTKYPGKVLVWLVISQKMLIH